MINAFRIPFFAITMAVYLALFMCSPAVAGLIASAPSSVEMADKVRSEEVHRIQQALEKQIVAEKLKAYGLSAEEINTKLQNMSDEQIHLLAQASDRLLAGGDGGIGVAIGILIIVLLVVLIVKVWDKSIIIK